MKRHHHPFMAVLLSGLLTLQAQAQGTTGGAPAAPAAAPAAPARPPATHPAPHPAPSPNGPVTPVTPIAPIAPITPITPPTPPSPITPPGAMMAEGRIYTPGTFDGVEIGGSAEVRYQQGDVDEVFVAGDSEVQRSVSVEVRGSQLRIQSQNNWRFWNTRRLQVQVISRQLTRLSIQGAADWVAVGPVNSERLAVHISGAGLARFDKLNSENLSFSVSGAGEGQFQGQVQDLSVQISGKSDFRGENLQARNARVTISGIGDVKVWAVNDLNINVSGIGQVEYWGKPNIRQRTSGPTTITARGTKAAP